MAKWVCTFGQGEAENESASRDLLGGKGAGLAEMARLGLPVPPGFTITTEVCAYFYKNGKQFPPSLAAEVETALGSIGRFTGRCFGDEVNPLLVSARSGARESMPG
ncbi:MAG: PEP/pyruvate-binding domain-containing protein, partial [Methylocella sp.]